MKPKKVTSYYDIFFDTGVGIFLFGLIAYIYRGLFNTFFQQDEWASLGLVIANGPLGILTDYSLIDLLSGKQRVLGSLINNIFHYYFPFNIAVFSAFSILIHTINSFLVYTLIRQIQKHKIYAVIGALFFATLTVPNQTVSWISAQTTALPNATFVLLSLMSLFRYLNNNTFKSLYFSYIFAYISFLFKESSAFIFVFIPLTVQIIAGGKILSRDKWKIVSPAILILFSVVIIRIMSLQGSEGTVGVYVTKDGNTIQKMIFHSFLYPIVGFSQLVIPSEIMFKIATIIQQLFYGFLNSHPLRESIIHIMITDLLSVFSTLIICISIALVWYLRPTFRNLIINFTLFTFMSFLPLIVLDRPLSSYLESRYYYLGAIGISLLIALCFESLISHQILKQFKIIGSIFIFGLYMGCSIYVYKNILYTKRYVQSLVERSSERIHVLKLLHQFENNIPDNPIFLIEGDSPGYYGLSDLAVPFQQGMGYTLMVVYSKTKAIPKEFFVQSFLWNINEQGYKVKDRNGFGYFWNREKLISTFLQDPSLDTGQLFSLSYTTSTRTLMNTTDELVKQINYRKSL